MSAVTFEDVAVAAADGRALLAGVTLDVREGEALALVGPSGGGKTTALKCVNALRLPSRGVVRVAGTPTTGWDPIRLRRRTGYVIQEVGLFPHLTVEQNVALALEITEWRGDPAARVREMLALVGLDAGLGARRPAELSGGQRQRVGVARALAPAPPLLLLDEPFAALDPVTRFALQSEFRALRERLGTTAIFVTHDLREAMRVADRIAVIADGRVVTTLTPDRIAASCDPVVRGLREASGL